MKGDDADMGWTAAAARARPRPTPSVHGWRGHGVNIGVVGKTGVRVVVECWNLFNLRKQALINLLNIWAG